MPALRFPEFRDAGDWAVENLGMIAKFFKGKGLPKSEINLTSSEPCIHYGQLFTEYSEVITNVISRTNGGNGYFLSVENDVLMPTSDVTPKGLAKSSAININGVILGGDILIIRADKNILLGNFLSRYIRYMENKVLRLVSGSTVFHLYSSSMEKFEVTFPTLPEQQKIAACLSSLDELISAQTSKIATLKTHKKGLMQKLFPAEGETVPALRFPEFRDAGDWEVKSLKDVCQMQAGKFVRAAEIFEKQEASYYPCYGGNGLRGFTKSFTHEGKYSLIGRQGALCGNITLALDKFHATEHAVVVSPKNNINTDWLFYMLGYLRLNQYATGQAQPGLSVENLEKLPIVISNSEKEQQKIAACLSSLDELISAQTEKLAALKIHKQGLMQKLFPAMSALD